jgi:hypothetical protein
LALLTLAAIAGGTALMALEPPGAGQASNGVFRKEPSPVVVPRPAPEQTAAPTEPALPAETKVAENESSLPEVSKSEFSSSSKDSEAARVRLFRLHLNVVPEGKE